MPKLKKTILTLILILTFPLYSDSRTVLVTGGAGYIGSHACKALHEAGFIPVTYDSLVLGEKEAVKWGPLVVGDLLDAAKLDQLFQKYKPFAVLHFAGLRNVGESVKDPQSYYTNNVAGSIQLLNTAVKHQVQYVIFSSSCTVYGESLLNSISETSHKNPTNPYAMSKYVTEKMIADYARAYGFKYMLLRYFNAAGIELESGLSRSIHSMNFLIPRALDTILHPEVPLQIFGTDYPTFDGTAIRDYIHVKDLALAHVLALNYLQAEEKSDEINLGTGKGHSVYNILESIEKITGYKVPYQLNSRREGDVPSAVAEVKKAKEVLHFEPSFSDLHTIIQSEWTSLQRNYNSSKD